MRIHITARRLRLTPSIRAYVEEKVLKVQKYFNHIIWAQTVLSVEKRSHLAEIVVHAARQTFRAQAKGTDLYAAVDLASDKIDAQLKKYKERLRNHHKGTTAGLAAELLSAEESVRFSVVKDVPLRPMSSNAAAEEMERLGYAFWVFLEEQSRQVQVVYRRQDDSYGILQPVKWNGK